MSTEKNEVKNLRPKHAPLVNLDEVNTLERKSPKGYTEGSMEAPEDTTDPEEVSIIRKTREDGKFRYTVPITLQGISSMLLPPLTKRKVAIYEVIGSNQIDPLTKEKVDTPPLILPGRFRIYDRFESDPLKKYKMLKYITRTEPVLENGREILKEYVEDIIFVNGLLTVPVERNYLLYCLLELHPLNASNRNRDTTEDSPVFRRQDMDRRNWAQSMVAMDLAFEAESAVVSLKKELQVLEIAAALGVPTANRRMEGDESIKHDLRIFARNNPIDFFKVVKNTAAAVKLQVMDAIQIGLVEWNLDRREWTFTTDGSVIGTIPVTHDPTEGLINLLLKEEYQEAYRVLTTQLNYWE